MHRHSPHGEGMPTHETHSPTSELVRPRGAVEKMTKDLNNPRLRISRSPIISLLHDRGMRILHCERVLPLGNHFAIIEIITKHCSLLASNPQSLL